MRELQRSGIGLGLAVQALTKLLILGGVLGSAMPLPAQTVHGRLLEQGSGRPITAGLLTLVGEAGETVAQAETDSAGGFTLRAPDPGSFYVRAERIGYRTKTDGVLELGEGGEITIDFYLVPRPVELEGVEGTAEAMDFFERKDREYLEWQGFYDRKKMGFGYFFGPEDIKWHMFDAWDVFRKIPGLGVTPPPRSKVRRPCVWIDGMLAHRPDQGDWAMADDVPIEAIAGMEVYTRGRPLQYGGVACSAGSRSDPPLILIWTKG